ncbi:uncharacterized protein LOC133199667 [Saccostrea echinata]|uniref:uncharacterized protein LOC133199667 n=1 Tax=Saccostrea echinata TaxID=191078 RepID=UPI002A7EA8B4|nr:uncharacterized protein LOC133199667 [Saccostrea echinata]
MESKLTTESSTTEIPMTSMESSTTNVTEVTTGFTTTNLSPSTPEETTKASTTETTAERSTATTSTQVTTKTTASEAVTQGPIAPESQTGTDAKTERAITVVVSVTIVGILMAILAIVFKRRKKIPFRKQRNPIGITYRHFSSGISSIYDQIILPEMDLLNFDSEKEDAGDINEVGAYYQNVHTEVESDNGNLVSTEEQKELINHGSINHVIQNGGNTKEHAVDTNGVNIENSKKISVAKNQNGESNTSIQLNESPSHVSVINVRKSSQSGASGDRPEQTMTRPNAKNETKKNVSVIHVSKS